MSKKVEVVSRAAAPDGITITPSGNSCTVTITFDATAERATALDSQAKKRPLAEITKVFSTAILYRVIGAAQKAIAAQTKDDAAIDAEAAAEAARKVAEAAALKAARPTVGDPTK